MSIKKNIAVLVFLIGVSIAASSKNVAADESLTPSINPNAGIEAQVREYFADIPVMITIAKCESGFRQYTANGQTMKDATNTYIGLFQIDEQLHFITSWSMNMNLYTAEGNMAYARYLYGKNGTNPWKGCLGNTTAPAAPTTQIVSPIINPITPVNGSITRNLRMGMTNDQVLLLQQLLNKYGFTIASSGPGSPGNETTMFGSLTRDAVRKFQCAKNIVCDGNEGSTGYGRIGPSTRAALNTLH